MYDLTPENIVNLMRAALQKHIDDGSAKRNISEALRYQSFEREVNMYLSGLERRIPQHFVAFVKEKLPEVSEYQLYLTLKKKFENL